jgi:hypothetical protein
MATKLLNDRYTIIEELGSGAFGKAFRVRDEQDSDMPT